MTINPHKSRVLYGGKNNPKQKYFIEGIEIPEEECIRDLGIMIDNKLAFDTHLNKIIRNGYFRAHQILRVLKSRDIQVWRQAYISYVRPLLEYSTETWNPKSIQDIKRIEKVQKFFTRKAQQKCRLKYRGYESRLRSFNLLSLEFRRLITDLVMVYKITHQKTSLNPQEFLNISTRENHRLHNFQLKAKRKTSKNQHSFVNRIINIWNKLDYETVNAETINSFKGKLIVNIKKIQAQNSGIINLVFPIQ